MVLSRVVLYLGMMLLLFSMVNMLLILVSDLVVLIDLVMLHIRTMSMGLLAKVFLFVGELRLYKRSDILAVESGSCVLYFVYQRKQIW